MIVAPRNRVDNWALALTTRLIGSATEAACDELRLVAPERRLQLRLVDGGEFADPPKQFSRDYGRPGKAV